MSSGVVLGGGQQRASLGMAPRSASLTAAQSCLAAPQPIHRTFPGCLLCPGHCHSAECVSERNTAVPALMNSYRPPRHLHTRSASSAHGKSGCWARWRGVPSACLGGVRHSRDGLGILCPILGPARGGEGQGPPEVSVTTAAVCTPPPVTDTAPQPREGRPPPGEVAPGGWRLSLSWSLSSGHPAQAEWQVLEQGVEEEVRDTLRQRAAHLPPQPARESGRPALGEAGAEGQGQRVASWPHDLSEFKWTLP